MDMLIKLYGPSNGPTDPLRSPPFVEGVDIRKPIGPEHITVARWVEKQFGVGWSSEVQVALANRPVSAWLATRSGDLLGFACYDATALGFFGPIGVSEAARGQHLGAALLLACLRDMRTVGYGYAMVGGAGAPEFFRRVAGATEIPDSTPGVYAGMLAR